MSENGNQLKYENWNYSKKHGLRCTYNAVSEENDNGLLSKSAIFLNGDLWHETTYTYTYF
ncbi:hypothetical protein SDC9_103451 [bioreactor metagenome]|uniref:Uncharacterized protein n=1 Tax=bioreactor metagenome TaxID=1076179 RepID=A0A645ATQ6_9ZZZZ